MKYLRINHNIKCNPFKLRRFKIIKVNNNQLTFITILHIFLYILQKKRLKSHYWNLNSIVYINVITDVILVRLVDFKFTLNHR